MDPARDHIIELSPIDMTHLHDPSPSHHDSREKKFLGILALLMCDDGCTRNKNGGGGASLLLFHTIGSQRGRVPVSLKSFLWSYTTNRKYIHNIFGNHQIVWLASEKEGGLERMSRMDGGFCSDPFFVYRPTRITPAAASFWILVLTLGLRMWSCRALGSLCACWRMDCMTGSCIMPIIWWKQSCQHGQVAISTTTTTTRTAETHIRILL